MNDNGVLGHISMTAVDDALYRMSADTKNTYKVLDTSNWSSYAMAARPASIELTPGSSAEHGGFIDFHYNGSSSDHTSRIIEQTSGEIAINGISVKGNIITGSLNGNASSATKLANACSVQTNLASTSAASFNGTVAITPGVTGILGIGNGGTGASSAVNAREKLHVARRDSVAQSAINDIDETGLYTQTSNAGLLIHLRWDDNYSAQIRNSYNHNTFNYRVKITSSAGWQNWRRFLWAPEGTAVGNGNTPIYINTDGTPVACGSLEAAILRSSATPTYGINGLQYFNASLSTSDTADGTISYAPTEDWWHILRMNHGNADGYYIDIGACFHQNYLTYRRVTSGNDSGWFRILDEKSGVLKSGDTMTGTLDVPSVRITNANHAPLTIERSGTTYYASISFKNSLGVLGHIGMTSVNGHIARLSADTNTVYPLLDASNYATYCLPKNPYSIELLTSTSSGHGGFIDFHYNGSTADHTSRIIESSSGNININGVNFKSNQITAGSYAVPRIKSWDGSTLTLVP